MSLSRFATYPRVPGKWIRYGLFRLTPVLLGVCLTIGIMQKMGRDSWNEVGIAVLTTWALSSIRQLFAALKPVQFVAVRLMHLIVVAGCAAVAGAMYGLSFFVTFAWLPPSWSSLRDGLWVALSVAIALIWYVRITDLGDHNRVFPEYDLTLDSIDEVEEDEEEPGRVTIVGRYNPDDEERCRQRLVAQKLGDLTFEVMEAVEAAAKNYEHDVLLLTAIVIYEDLNRPRPIRFLENLLVRLPGVELTVGIAQVRSSRPLTDEESIWKMAEYIQSVVREEGSSRSVILRCYNSGYSYESDVEQIYQDLSAGVGSEYWPIMGSGDWRYTEGLGL